MNVILTRRVWIATIVILLICYMLHGKIWLTALLNAPLVGNCLALVSLSRPGFENLDLSQGLMILGSWKNFLHRSC